MLANEGKDLVAFEQGVEPGIILNVIAQQVWLAAELEN